MNEQLATKSLMDFTNITYGSIDRQERCEKLRNWHHLITKHEDDLAELLTLEQVCLLVHYLFTDNEVSNFLL